MEVFMDSIIFDVDGTLWDSTEKVAIAWQKVVERHNVPADHITPARLKQEFGKTMIAISRSLFPDLPEEIALDISNESCTYEIDYLLMDSPEAYPGVAETFRALSKKLPLFIVSNSQAGYIEAFLKITGLGDYVTDILSFGDTGNEKDSNIRAIVEKNHLKSPVYVGDTLGDLKASEAAGVPFIFCEYGFGDITGHEAAAHISDITDLIALCDEGTV
jgi:phosphoglycolate phosphatase